MNARHRHPWAVPASALVLLALPWVGPRAGGQTAPTPAIQAEAESRPVRQRPSGGLETRPLRKDEGGTGSGWLKTVGALALVAALILAARAVLRRLAGPGRRGPRGGAIEVLARAPLAGRHQLSLVRLGRRLVLIGASQAGMSTLAEITDPDEVEELLGQVRAARGASFADLFGRYAGQRTDEGAGGREDGSPGQDGAAGGKDNSESCLHRPGLDKEA